MKLSPNSRSFAESGVRICSKSSPSNDAFNIMIAPFLLTICTVDSLIIWFVVNGKGDSGALHELSDETAQ